MQRAWVGTVASVVVGACYAPSVTPGAPCDPLVDNCPAGLRCLPAGAEHRCLGDGLDGGADAVGSPSDGGADAPRDGDAPTDAPTDAALVDRVEYVASVADCVDPLAPNPDACGALNGAAQLVVDMRDSMTLHPWEGFVRFDLDGQLAGRVVTSLKLRMVATDDDKAPGTNTGRIWQVGAFTRAELFGGVPSRIGTVPLAGSQGALSKLEVVDWTLPVSLATANGHVYLSVDSTSDDGVNYWNLTGPNPPRLVVELE